MRFWNDKSTKIPPQSSLWSMTLSVSQYQVRKVWTCVLGISDFTSSTRECDLLRTGGHKSGNSANGTAVYLITSVSSPTLYYNTMKYDIIHHCLFLFSCKHINSRKNVFQGTYIHYSEKTYYIKQHCLFSVSFRILIATKCGSCKTYMHYNKTKLYQTPLPFHFLQNIKQNPLFVFI